MNQHSRTRLLDPFLKPASIVIIGLSRAAVGSPVSVLTTLQDNGYAGTIYIVNPSMPEIPGATVLKSVAELKQPVDLAIISVARVQVPATLQECASAGIRSAIIITQGFADADAEGAALQAEIQDIARRSRMRIVGPNTIGVACTASRFSSSFIETATDDLPIGQVAQSGFLMMGHHLVTNEPGGFCMSVDVGNACDINLNDVLDYFAEEESVKVVECHMEAVEDGEAFLRAARKVTARKPMVVLKAGRTAAGQAAVSSHTGAVAGQARIYDAAFAEADIIAAESAEDLRCLSKSLAFYPSMRGRRVAVVSFSGGGAVLGIDALDRAGLQLAELADSTIARIRDLFPEWMEVHNPLDIWIPVAKDLHTAFPRILKAALEDEGVDAVLCIYCSYNLPKYEQFNASVHIRDLSAACPDKPIACWSYGQDIDGFTRTIEEKRSAMVFPSLDAAARALAVRARETERLAAPRARQQPPVPLTPHPRAAELLAEAKRKKRGYLFTDALEILDAYGLPMPKWAAVDSERGLEGASAGLAAPLCLKVDSQEVVHKSDSGGVVLGIGKGEELLDAFRGMVAKVWEYVPRARIERVVLQEMAEPGVEVMIGVTRDVAFGPCVVFGAGGIHAELMDDFVLRIAPLSPGQAMEMILQTRIARVLQGARGKPPADLNALAELLSLVSRIAAAHPEIVEMDLNPVFVGRDGVSVVDVRMMVG